VLAAAAAAALAGAGYMYYRSHARHENVKDADDVGKSVKKTSDEVADSAKNAIDGGKRQVRDAADSFSGQRGQDEWEGRRGELRDAARQAGEDVRRAGRKARDAFDDKR